MKLGVKIAIAAAAVGGIIFVAKKVTDKKYTEVNVTVKDEEKESVLDKIKKAAVEKVIQILDWGHKHFDQIKTASEIVGLVGGVVSLAYTIHQFRTKGKIEKQLNRIEEYVKQNPIDAANYGYVQGYSDQWNHMLGTMSDCAKDGVPVRFLHTENGSPVKQFKVQEVVA